MPKLFYLLLQFILLLVFLLFFYKKFLITLFKVRGEVAVVVLIVCYVCARDLVAGNIVYLDRFVGWFFQSFIIGIALLVLFFSFNERHGNKYGFIITIYATVVFAALLTLLLYISPAFDSFYEGIQLDAYYEIYSGFEKRYRAYGVAENLTFTYAYVLGLMAGYSLILARHSLIYFLFLPVLIFSVSINARVGFLGFSLVVLHLLFFGRLVDKAYLIAVSCLSFFLIVVFGVALIDDYSWQLGFFFSIYDILFSGGSGGGTVSALLSNHMVFPNNLVHWIFGSGYSLFGLAGGGDSDIGYIIQLNYGGLLLLLLIFVLIFCMSVRLCFVLGVGHWYAFVFPLSIILLNFKGFVFAMTPGGRLLVFLYIFYIMAGLKEKLSPCVTNYNPMKL